MKDRDAVHRGSGTRPIPWVKAAERFIARVPTDRLHPEVMHWVQRKRQPLPAGWGVAFSGGADSLALLLAVRELAAVRGARVVALHFNHRLRGRASTSDEAFCRRVCTGLKVKLVVGRWAAAKRDASEAEARAARFRFFEQRLRACRSRVLWLGHQQDDIAETLLMRLARGSGTAGLAAPRPAQRLPNGRVHLRPLLSLKKQEIVEALVGAGVPWREDASNAGDGYLRNRMRRSVIPAWRKAAGDRDALAGAALSRELAEEDDRALEAWLDELLPRWRGPILDLAPLGGKPRALLRRALHRWLIRQPGVAALSRQGFSALLNALEKGTPTRQSLGKNGFAVIQRNRLQFKRPLRNKHGK